jgi:hypothetical protein
MKESVMVRRFQATTMTVMHLESKGMAMVVGKILILINMRQSPDDHSSDEEDEEEPTLTEQTTAEILGETNDEDEEKSSPSPARKKKRSGGSVAHEFLSRECQERSSVAFY